LRETKEETGLTSPALSIDEHLFHKISYLWRGRPKTIALWLAELKDLTEVRLSKEHLDYRWLSVEEAASIAAYDEMAVALRDSEQILRSRVPMI
jgi:8-oxo-dGTP pyrophosphatase MutT (NUDIX family)